MKKKNEKINEERVEDIEEIRTNEEKERNERKKKWKKIISGNSKMIKCNEKERLEETMKK